MGHQPFGLFLCLCFYVERAFNSAGRASAAVELVGGWLDGTNGPIALILSYHETNHTRRCTGKHTTVDRLCINGVKNLTEHGFLPPFLHLFLFFLSPAFLFGPGSVSSLLSSSYCFFLSILFPYLPAAGFASQKTFIYLFFVVFVFVVCLILQCVSTY